MPGDVQGLRFGVEDTGIGIPPEKHAHIFKPFSQVDCSIARSYGVTGLGHTITRRLVNLIGGLIKLESEPVDYAANPGEFVEQCGLQRDADAEIVNHEAGKYCRAKRGRGAAHSR